ncbi:MAG: hypothetical protein ACW98X_01080 [Promethearchaeota archaeon]|jgi:hypothetical protein
MIADDFTNRIEMFSIVKAKLKVAEMVLKALKINYEIVSPRNHTSRLRRLMYEKPLDQVHDMLLSMDSSSKIYAEMLKKDFEARRYWRKQFQKFQAF